MRKLWQFVVKNFLTKKFLTFGIIGVLNTVIDLAVYQLFFHVIHAGVFWSNTVAFIVASVFSYFMNAIITFKPKNRNATQFSVIMAVYFVRLMTSNGLALLFNYMMVSLLHANYDLHPYLSAVAPFMASALLIPIAYFALDFVFKKTDIKMS
ncbi:MAG: GtrA family protein [Candidatus Izemoplasmatales bacterium]